MNEAMMSLLRRLTPDAGDTKKGAFSSDWVWIRVRKIWNKGQLF
jgi:hypothetical protein